MSGPLGAYEKKEFVKGTAEVYKAAVESGAFVVAGGGDTSAVIKELGLEEKFSYVSLAGGAFIEFVSGKKLPGVHMLERWYSKLKG